MESSHKIITVTPENVAEAGIYCIKDQKAPGYAAKKQWFEERYAKGLRLKIAEAEDGKQCGFIEYVPAEYAWRPVDADGYMFIHCMFVYPNTYRGLGVGDALITECEREAKEAGMSGVCVFTSKGAWLKDERIFKKRGYEQLGKQGRFELMAKKFIPDAPGPSIIDWKAQLPNYEGWHLIYADQCPWHAKAIEALKEEAMDRGIVLHVTQLKSAAEAKEAPSGFGVFSLIHDGRLLEDHYISQTRFKNILKKELGE